MRTFKVFLALAIAVILSGCLEHPPDGTYKKVVWEAETPTGGIRITYKPARTERRHAGDLFMVCPTQWMLYDYIDNGERGSCFVGYLAGNPVRSRHNGRTVYSDYSPVKPRFYTPL